MLEFSLINETWDRKLQASKSKLMWHPGLTLGWGRAQKEASHFHYITKNIKYYN
jgi:hypothetical protein